MAQALSMNLPFLLLFFLGFATAAYFIGVRLADENTKPTKYNKLNVGFKENTIKTFIISFGLGLGFLIICNIYIYLRGINEFDNINVANSVFVKQGLIGEHLKGDLRKCALKQATARVKDQFPNGGDVDIKKNFMSHFFEEVKSSHYNDGHFNYSIQKMLNVGLYECKDDNKEVDSDKEHIWSGPLSPIIPVATVSSSNGDKGTQSCKNYDSIKDGIKKVLTPKLFPLGGYYNVSPKEIVSSIKHMDCGSSFEEKFLSVNAAGGASDTDNVKPEVKKDVFLFLEGYIRHIKDAMFPMIRTSQMIVGPIQFATYVLFFFGIILASMRLRYMYKEIASPGEITSIEEKYVVKDYFDEVISIPLNFVLWVLPTVGFIGTVVGISKALGDADKVVMAKGALEQSDAINLVTSLLSEAFDTTLIALVCSIPVFILAYWAGSKEAKWILNFPDNPQPAYPSPNTSTNETDDSSS